MPRYNLPREIIEPRIIQFHDLLSLKFKVGGSDPIKIAEEWSKIYSHGGYRQYDFAILPLTSPYLCGPYIKLPPEQLHVECVDLDKREIIVRTSERKYENMEFPAGTHAIIIDTDLPVSEHFADNLCAYCTGIHAPHTEDAWMERFYSELRHPGNTVHVDENGKWHWANPYARSAQYVWTEKFGKPHKLTPCSPWPTPDWASNGLSDFCNLDTMRTLNDRQVHEKEVTYYYQWPARFSVALFFSKQITDLYLNIIIARANTFCEWYPNAYYEKPGGSKYHCVTDVRIVKLGDTEQKTKSVPWLYAKEPPINRTPSLLRGRQKVKVEIEEVGNTL